MGNPTDIPPGSKITNMNVTRMPNGDITAHLGVDVGPNPNSDESQANSTGNLTDPSSYADFKRNIPTMNTTSNMTITVPVRPTITPATNEHDYNVGFKSVYS